MTSDIKPCISGKGVTKIFGIGNKCNIAVNHVDFEFRQGEIISIVGESGSGKTTLFKMILGILGSSEGEFFFDGKPRDLSTGKKRREYWKNIQAVFQDPFASFNMFIKVDSVLRDCINLKGNKHITNDEKRQITDVNGELLDVDSILESEEIL